MAAEPTNPQPDKGKQPRCPTCGRFAYWDEHSREWKVRCVFWDDYLGGWEHE